MLAVVICAIALSLAYPVREYIAQRRQIDQLVAQRQATVGRAGAGCSAEAAQLNDPAYIEQQARDRLHMCMPGQTCYVIIGRPAGPQRPGRPRPDARHAVVRDGCGTRCTRPRARPRQPGETVAGLSAVTAGR